MSSVYHNYSGLLNFGDLLQRGLLLTDLPRTQHVVVLNISSNLEEELARGQSVGPRPYPAGNEAVRML
jgi:hypothetical protein